MIYLYYGDDRLKIQQEITKLLGNNYEVFDGSDLDFSDLPSIFFGTSLFGESRHILIKDLSENKNLFSKLVDYLDSPHAIALWEKAFDKRTKLSKQLTQHKNLSLKEFKVPIKINRSLAFDIYDVAMRDGVRAVKMLEMSVEAEDPYRLLGAWAWKALDNFKKSPGAKEKRVLKELSKLDIQMKTTRLSSQPWLLLQSFLLRASSL